MYWRPLQTKQEGNTLNRTRTIEIFFDILRIWHPTWYTMYIYTYRYTHNSSPFAWLLYLFCIFFGSSTTFEICFVFAFVFVCLSCILEDIKQRGMNGEKRKKKGRPDLGRYYVKLVYMRCTHTQREREVSSSISCLSSAVSTLEFFSLPLVYIQTCISYEWLSLSLSLPSVDGSTRATHIYGFFFFFFLLLCLYYCRGFIFLVSPLTNTDSTCWQEVSLSLFSLLSVLFFVPQPQKNLDRHRRPRPGLSLTKDTDNKNKSKRKTDRRTGRKTKFFLSIPMASAAVARAEKWWPGAQQQGPYYIPLLCNIESI